MNKAELVDAIAKKAGGSKAMADVMIDAFIDAVTGSLKKGESVTLVGFGTFSQGKRAARSGRNPQTGVAIKIPAAKTAKFAPAQGSRPRSTAESKSRGGKQREGRQAPLFICGAVARRRDEVTEAGRRSA